MRNHNNRAALHFNAITVVRWLHSLCLTLLYRAAFFSHLCNIVCSELQLSRIERETLAFGTLLPPTRIWHQISRIRPLVGVTKMMGVTKIMGVPVLCNCTLQFCTCMCTHTLDIPISISMCQPPLHPAPS